MANSKLEPGSEAPGFTLPDPGGAGVSLEDFRGSWVVLYFYPRDDTPGCTAEAVDFTAGLPDFGGLNAVVIGISPDTGARHGKFMAKHGLGIRLLSDTGREVIKRYGAWRIKKMYGMREFINSFFRRIWLI